MPEHHLTLRPTALTGDKLIDDYCVWREGRCIGRIRLAREYSAANWTWFINPPLAIPAWSAGAADTLEDAKLAFRKAWGTILRNVVGRRHCRPYKNDDLTQAGAKKVEQ